MGAPDVLLLLRESGLTVTTDDGRLIVTPADRLTDETRQLIRENKSGILDALAFTSYRWLIHFADREPMEIFMHPDADFARMMREYPDCVAAEPLPEPARREYTVQEDSEWAAAWAEASPSHSCSTCAYSRRPGGVSRYCSARPDLPPAYGERHPLRQLPDDGGDGCGQWIGRKAPQGFYERAIR